MLVGVFRCRRRQRLELHLEVLGKIEKSLRSVFPNIGEDLRQLSSEIEES